jgi:hypothetical protein
MTTLNYGQLSLDKQQQVNSLIADLKGQSQDTPATVRFVARGLPSPGGEFGGVG